MTRSGWGLITGGVLWLAGVGLLESGRDIESWSVRVGFTAAGILIAVDLVALRARLPSRVARVGVVALAAAAAGVGVGVASDSYPGFLAAYVGLLFVIPVSMALFGLGLWRGGGLPAWATWIPLLLAGAGVVTYGFHAIAREIWDPPDSVMFLILGLGWLLVGVAALQRPSDQVVAH